MENQKVKLGKILAKLLKYVWRESERRREIYIYIEQRYTKRGKRKNAGDRERALESERKQPYRANGYIFLCNVNKRADLPILMLISLRSIRIKRKRNKARQRKKKLIYSYSISANEPICTCKNGLALDLLNKPKSSISSRFCHDP